MEATTTMIRKILRPLAGSALVAAATFHGASAQEESTNRVAVETAWSVFVEQDPKQCWGVSGPTEVVNTDVDTGEVKQGVSRGDILLFVTFIPGQNVSGQVSFTGGYPFADGSTVTLEIGGSEFDLFTIEDDDPNTSVNEEQLAFAASESDDQAIVAAMKRGAEAVLTARSSRGTQTEDTFSLYGFTAAMEEATERCSGSS